METKTSKAVDIVNSELTSSMILLTILDHYILIEKTLERQKNIVMVLGYLVCVQTKEELVDT